MNAAEVIEVPAPVRSKALEVLAKARIIIAKLAPYFRPLLLRLVPREEPGIDTMAVTRLGVLLYNPQAVVEWGERIAAGVLVHEMMHVWLGHHKRLGSRDPFLWNVAGDLSIWHIVDGFGLPLPEGALTPRGQGFPDKLTAEEYYQLLMRKSEDQRPRPGGKAVPGQGQCGGCAGNPGDDEDEGDDEEGREARADREDGRAPAEIERGVHRVADAAQQHIKSQGSLPGGLDRLVERTLAPPKVPWQRKLQYAVRFAAKYRPGSTVPRYDEIPVDQWGIGYGHGRPVLPSWYNRVLKAAIAVDTSGSMGPDDLAAALREAQGILRALGAPAMLLACDAKVHEVGRITTAAEAAKLLKGGGGTSFVPVFEYIEAMPPERRPELLVYATDGYGRAPDKPPRGLHTIWLLIGKGAPKPSRWGAEVRVDS